MGGAVAAAGVTLGTFSMPNNWGWRIPSFLQVLPSILQVSFIWFLPESPRWLISKGRGIEAYTILVKYHAEGDEYSDFVKAECSQIEKTLEAELKIAQINQKEVFSTPGMRKRVIVAFFLGLFVQWSGVGLISHFLSLILDNIGIHDNRTKNVINLAKHSWSLVNSTVSALIAPRYPRRGIYLACTISLFVVFTAWTIASAEYSLTQSKASAQAVLAGITIFQWSNRGGAFVNQFVNPIGIEAAGWKWYIIYCVWNAFQVVFVYLMFPETSGRTLEELAFLYEDDQESFSHDGVEMLHEHRETERYGSMEGTPRRTVRGDRDP
ncbi:hexose transporter [Lanmaoa asiatica]|nr:hexose transporter [Lanmaoa asiatica]